MEIDVRTVRDVTQIIFIFRNVFDTRQSSYATARGAPSAAYYTTMSGCEFVQTDVRGLGQLTPLFT